MPPSSQPLAAPSSVPSPPWLDTTAWPWTPRFLDVGEGRLHYVDEGPRDAPVVLLVHGTPTWAFEYRHVLRALLPHRRCIAVDHLGFGLSERPTGADYSPEAHARRLARFVTGLGLERFSLVVHDYGGPIGLPLAVDDPACIDKLVLLNTWMWSADDDAHLRRGGAIAGSAVGRFLYRHANLSQKWIMPAAYGDKARLTPTIHGQYLSVFPDKDSRGEVLWPLARGLLGASAFFASLWERRARLRGVDALLIWGMKDTALRPEALARWRQALPQAKVVELAGVGHWPHEEEPERVSVELVGFLVG